MSQLTQAFPDKSFSGIGGISTFEHALNYFLLGCGTVQVCTAAMLDHAIGPNVIRALNQGLARFLEKHADKGWTRVDDFVGLRRDRIVAQSKIRRADRKGLSRRLRGRGLCRAESRDAGIESGVAARASELVDGVVRRSGGLGRARHVSALEIVLGIDNIVFISILAGQLPHDQQARARTIGPRRRDAVADRAAVLAGLDHAADRAAVHDRRPRPVRSRSDPDRRRFVPAREEHPRNPRPDRGRRRPGANRPRGVARQRAGTGR